jgi:hypothetical protein
LVAGVYFQFAYLSSGLFGDDYFVVFAAEVELFSVVSVLDDGFVAVDETRGHAVFAEVVVGGSVFALGATDKLTFLADWKEVLLAECA